MSYWRLAFVSGSICIGSLLFFVLAVFLEFTDMLSQDQVFLLAILATPLLLIAAPLAGLATVVLLLLGYFDSK